MSDDDIDTSDIPELGNEFWKNARVRYPTENKDRSIPDARTQDTGYNRSKRGQVVALTQHFKDSLG